MYQGRQIMYREKFENMVVDRSPNTVLIIAINRMMKCTKDINSDSNLGFPRLVKDHQKFLKSADKHQRYINSTLFLLNSHEIIKK